MDHSSGLDPLRTAQLVNGDASSNGHQDGFLIQITTTGTDAQIETSNRIGYGANGGSVDRHYKCGFKK
eukprot:6623530-Prymnesium_polylepis.1